MADNAVKPAYDDLEALSYGLSHYVYKGTYYENRFEVRNMLLDNLPGRIQILYEHLISTDHGYRTETRDSFFSDQNKIRNALKAKDAADIVRLCNTQVNNQDHPEWDKDRKDVLDDIVEVCGRNVQDFSSSASGTDRFWPRSVYDKLITSMHQFFARRKLYYSIEEPDRSDENRYIYDSFRFLKHLKDNEDPDINFGDESPDSPLFPHCIPADSDISVIGSLYYQTLALYGDGEIGDLVSPDLFEFFYADPGQPGSIDSREREDTHNAGQLAAEELEYPHVVRKLGSPDGSRNTLYVVFTQKSYATTHNMLKNRRIVTADNMKLGISRGRILIIPMDEFGEAADAFTDEDKAWIEKNYGSVQYFDNAGPDPLTGKHAHDIALQTYLTIMLSSMPENTKISELQRFGFSQDDLSKLWYLYHNQFGG